LIKGAALPAPRPKPIVPNGSWAQLYGGSKVEPPAAATRCNPNVSKILPVTTLRTIDLGGKKFPVVCFQYFARKRAIFLQKIVHQDMCKDETSLPTPISESKTVSQLK
jgi:hypothetical protein